MKSKSASASVKTKKNPTEGFEVGAKVRTVQLDKAIEVFLYTAENDVNNLYKMPIYGWVTNFTKASDTKIGEMLAEKHSYVKSEEEGFICGAIFGAFDQFFDDEYSGDSSEGESSSKKRKLDELSTRPVFRLLFDVKRIPNICTYNVYND